MKLKIFCLSLICVFIFVFNTGCSASEDGNRKSNKDDTRALRSFDEERYLTFEELISVSNCAVAAEYVAFHISENGNYVEYEFRVNEVLYGDVPEETIYLFSVANGIATVDTINYSYTLGEEIYTAGEEYILIMEKHESLFYEHTEYISLSDTYISTSDIKNSTMYREKIDSLSEVEPTRAEALTFIKDIKSSMEDKGYVAKKNYIESDDIREIVAGSDLALEVKVVSIQSEGMFANFNAYVCEVLDVVNGGTVTKTAGNKIVVNIRKNSVKVGGRYIILVNGTGTDSFIYNQSAKNSVIPADDKELADEVRSIAEQ